MYVGAIIMSIFEDVISVDNNGNIIYNEWIEWDHFLVPTEPEWYRDIMRALLAILGHCLRCTSLDGCYFINTKKPEDIHDFCDCTNFKIPFSKVKNNAIAECNISKFTDYIFKSDSVSKGKLSIFKKLGYSIEDSQFLQSEICKQAKTQYLLGNYVLKNLDMFGQRLAIAVNLNGTSFYSGWKLCPKGRITNTTPFAGWIK